MESCDATDLLKFFFHQAVNHKAGIHTTSFKVEQDGVVSKVEGYLCMKDGYLRTVTIALVRNHDARPEAWPEGFGRITHINEITGERRAMWLTVDDNDRNHPFTVSVAAVTRKPWERRGWED